MTYIGDPINAVRIFNDKEADELVILDISATRGGGPRYDLLERIAGEAFMPLAYGGGLSSVDQARRVLRTGFEKIVINTAAYSNPDLICALSATVGSQSVVISIDVKRNVFGSDKVFILGRATKRDPISFAVEMARRGAGEIIINSVDRDGVMKGYDLALIQSIVKAVDIPVVALGGAGSLEDMVKMVRATGASAAAAGSFFVFYGARRAVLITFPSQEEIGAAFRAYA
jgi:cyclase